MDSLRQTRVCKGPVSDPTGAVLSAAAVKVVNKSNGLTREGTTNGSGVYRFDLLSPGTYKVSISAKGFSSRDFDNVALAVSQTTTIDTTLTVGNQTEIVNVEGQAPLIDSTRSDVSLPITPQQLKDLPMNGRDFANLAVLAPGVRPVDSYDPTKNRIAVFSVDGSNGRNVNVTVNGIDNKDNTVGGPNMQLPLEAIEEFNISTQRFSAANGRSEGAAINVITKSGSNELHGSLYFLDRNEALNTNDYFAQQAGQEKAPYGRQQFGGSIGAPIRKDKDFIFFALEREREATNIVVTDQAFKELSLVSNLGAQPARAIPTPYFDWRYNGRIDHKINDKNNLFISYANQNNIGFNDQSSQTNDLTSGNFTTNQNIIANATLNSVISPAIVNSFTFGYQYWNNVIDSSVRSPNVIFPDASFGTNGNVPQQSYQVKWQFRDDVSITKGKHSMKFGGDLVWEPKLGGFFIYNATTAVTFFDDPSVILGNTTLYPQGFATPGAIQSISQTSGNPYFFLSAKQFGVYAQDDWKINRRLTLSLGLRFDRDYNLNGGAEQAQNRAYLILKAINSPFAGGLPHDDTKDFSPRIGFAYDLTGAGKHVLRGGFGLYYGQTFQNIPLFMLQQANSTLFTQVSYNSNGPTDTTADVVPGSGKLLSQFRYGVDPLPPTPAPPTKANAGDTANIVDPNYRNPVSEQFNFGYSWSVTPDSVIEADYVHVLGLHDMKNVVINPKINGVRFTDALTVAAGQVQIGRITDARSIQRDRYDGLNLTYRRHLTRHLQANLTYTLSKGVGYNGAAADYSDRPTVLTNIFGKQDFGPVPTDERHHFVASGTIELPWGILVAPIMQVGSARPYNMTQGISDVFGFGGGQGATHAFLLNSDANNYLATKGYTASQLRSCLTAGNCTMASYNYLRGQPFFQLDARFSKSFKIKERTKIDFIFQAFDLTNRANFGSNYQGNIKSGQFQQPLGFITPSGVIVAHSFSGEAGFHLSF